MFFKLQNNDVEIDSKFEYWVCGRRRFEVCQWSTGGDKKRANKQYMPAQELLLQRFNEFGMKIETIALVKGKKQSQPYEDVLEIDLASLDGLQDPRALRIQISKLTKDVDRDTLKAGGNPTRKVLFGIKWPGEGKLLDDDVRNALGFSPVAYSANETKYSPLGVYLASVQTDIVSLSLEEIGEMVGELPKSAASPQFWANAQGFHWSRRRHWLSNGFEAFWNSKEQKVRFVRNNLPTDDATLFKARVEFERKRLKAQGKGLDEPPSGRARPTIVKSVIFRYQRSPAIVAWVLEKATGHCEACSKEGPFISEKDERYLEVHHLRPLAEGGPDTIDNAVALCPDCHRELHFGIEREMKRDGLLKKVDRLIDHPFRDRG
ncbi:HNH endonuclease [Aliirhizobium cellulosilyticum]|uniref:HNH nuclease domain-containing protein n=1 Tax=Aliirhizobium cellulosilyticum TaxID=393664 RepID=A0A7W6TFP7_9HYPH|nr:HNH endonuclease signature motif containing protein [Rhizobium cellulosilyticum]MBB4349274.1 hypothetical protein [Rhizobium cellulosilyticum]MBB4412504.1 hypothetical protein [Rhizobium cellulosilyticum]MBB4447136.1 hypothetical protein [Rhizobium cellulosilyticum]